MKEQKILNKIRDTLLDHNMLFPGEGLVIGVSGGADSICLLHALYQLKLIPIDCMCVVHVNHMLRGPSAEDDQKYVEEFCNRLKIPCQVFRENVKSIAEKEGIGIEDCGRRVRYNAFEQVLDERFDGKGKIAVAHNKNDQAETVLMRILRGTGPLGLGGMEYVRQGRIIRPILDLTRTEVETYCMKNKLTFCRDESNAEIIYTRNRIRLELLPYIEQHFNPNIESSLNRLACLAREDNGYMDEIVEKFMTEFWEENEKTFPIEILRAQHTAIQRRLIIAGMQKIGMNKNASLLQVDSIRSLINRGLSAKQVDFPDGYTLRISYGKLWFIRKNEDISNRFSYESRVVSLSEMEQLSEDGRQMVFFDNEKLHEDGLTPRFRTRREGDWIRLPGGEGRKTLKKYMVDEKIPAQLRSELPLLARGSEIIWVWGFYSSRQFRPAPDTNEILCIEYFGAL